MATTPTTRTERRHAADRPPVVRQTARKRGRPPIPGLGLDGAQRVRVAVALGILPWAGIILALLWAIRLLR